MLLTTVEQLWKTVPFSVSVAAVEPRRGVTATEILKESGLAVAIPVGRQVHMTPECWKSSSSPRMKAVFERRAQAYARQ